MNTRGIASVHFICDFSPGFTGERYHGQGVGGTEAMVVVLAETLAAKGLRVTVMTPVGEGVHERGVTYARHASAEADITVLVKRWSASAEPAGNRRVFLMTDVHVTPEAALERCCAWAHRVAAISPYMRQRVAKACGRGDIEILSPPVSLDEYPDDGRTRERLMIYCSVPDRGLFYLKDIFPAVRKRVPDARLAITSDFTLWGHQPARAAFERFFAGQPGIEYVGHVDRATLVAYQRRARVMAYPCTFEEGFCIAAAECMAAGAVPVTTDAFALQTTVNGAGMLIRGKPRSWFYRRAFVRAAAELLVDDERWRAQSTACRTHARAMCDPVLAAEQLLALAAGEVRT